MTTDERELVETIADRYYGAGPAAIEPITNLNHVVYRLRFAAGDKILKVALGADGTSIRKELWLLDLLRQHSIPVAVVEHADADATVVGRPFFVMAVAGDQTVADWVGKPVPVGRPLFIAMGAVFGRIHKIRVPPPDTGPVLVGPRDIERERAAVLQVAEQLTAQELLTPEEVDEFKGLPLPSLEGEFLCHGDFHAVQCLVHEERIAAVVDWESAWSGNPPVDLAMTNVYMDFYCPVLLSRAFFAGYASVRPMPENYVINLRPVRLAQTLALAGVWLRQENTTNLQRTLDLYRAYARQTL